MDHKEFKQKLKDNNLLAYHLAQKLGITAGTITNWKKTNKYPNYINYYFETLTLHKKIIKLNSIISTLTIEKGEK